MKMVAAAKLRRAQERLLSARPYAESLRTIISHVAAQEDQSLHPLLAVRDPKRVGYLVITSDRGLCGSFNANVTRRAQVEIDSHQAGEATLSNFGRKGVEFFTRRGYELSERYVNLFNELEFRHAQEVAASIQSRYLSEEVDRVYVVYNRFKSAGSQEVRVDQVLPIEPAPPTAEKYIPAEYFYEPSAQRILDEAIPRNLRTQIWLSLLESNAAEHGARMVAMDSATENAKEMIYNLTLTYNKARQAAITTEISEIVGGAEALRG